MLFMHIANADFLMSCYDCGSKSSSLTMATRLPYAVCPLLRCMTDRVTVVHVCVLCLSNPELFASLSWVSFENKFGHDTYLWSNRGSSLLMIFVGHRATTYYIGRGRDHMWASRHQWRLLNVRTSCCIRERSGKFVDCRHCTADIQREAVLGQVVVVGVT
jgi:hypothetical protein